MKRIVLALIAILAVFLLAGCEDRRQHVVSDLNVIADSWEGKEEPPALEGKTDPWGRPYEATVVKSTYNYELTVRSVGPDGLPKNRDDITASRRSKLPVEVKENLLQKAYSDLNVIADTWDGKTDPPKTDGKVDPWLHPYAVDIGKTPLSNELVVRSNGPDGLPRNADDVYVRRYVRHGETTINKEAERGVASLTRGLMKGLKEGLLGEPKKKD